MKLHHKSFPLKVELKDDQPRTVEGWASTFGNVDSHSDVVVKGAFAASLAARTPKMLWQHDTDQPIGVWTAARETEKVRPRRVC